MRRVSNNQGMSSSRDQESRKGNAIMVAATKAEQRCRQCSARNCFFRDEDGDMRCILCGTPRGACKMSADEARSLGLDPFREITQDKVDSLDEPRTVIRFDGVGARFVWLTSSEIAERTAHAPLQSGEQDCHCLHSPPSPHLRGRTSTMFGRCTQCERLWVSWCDRMVLVPWGQRRNHLRRQGVAS